MTEFLTITFATFLSEDLTCITTGILIKESKISAGLSVFACTMGIYLGDLILFYLGFFFHKGLKSLNKFKNIFEYKLFRKYENDLDKHFVKVIFISRFMPGTRLPVYLIAGATGKYLWKFPFYSFIACIVWTPLLIGLAYLYSDTVLNFYNNKISNLSILFLAISFYIIYKISFTMIIKESRMKLFTSIHKLFLLEFWAPTIFYIPLIFYVLYLGIRYRGLRYFTVSNPAIPSSGIAGESKSEILSKLPEQSIAKFFIIPPDAVISSQYVKNILSELNIDFPLILKPDVGERGAGVSLVYSLNSLLGILENSNTHYILQEFHPGPFEAGIFYYRFPNTEKGKIFSVTDKVFPKLIGDGIQTVRLLLLTHKRFKFQVNTHLEINSDILELIPEKNQEVKLGFAGNHSQGCMFKDGSDLITDELENKIDEISKHFKGFFFGRYDIRYSDKELLKKGLDFKIIELNGAMSESTNLYDPEFSIFESYSYLFRQWKILFQIGYLNYKSGYSLTSWKELFGILKTHFSYKKQVSSISKIHK